MLKAGNQPAEFDPEKMPVVKFSDVLGCDEAKEVSNIICLVWKGHVMLTDCMSSQFPAVQEVSR